MSAASALNRSSDFLRHFWHPVCTLREIERRNPSGAGPIGARLLGEDLVVAKLDGRFVALRDRCAHRSAKPSLGKVTEAGIQCPYHGWVYDAQGRCVRIPACPQGPIPSRARLEAFECGVQYGIVWVRLDSTLGVTRIPYCSPWGDARYRVVIDEPSTWATTPARRWENFTDLSHFAFVHPYTLFDPDFPVPPIVPVDRVEGELRWNYDPPAEVAARIDKRANLGPARYRCSMPFTVNVEFQRFADQTRHVLWMTSSPVAEGLCRTFYIFARERDRDGSDEPYLEFQHKVFEEDRPVIESQSPAEIAADEIGVPTDKVSVRYRQWLRELERAAAEGAAAFRACLYTDRLETAEARQGVSL